MPTDSIENPPLPATVDACHTVIRESWGPMHKMGQRLQVLEEQIKLNSRTSSKLLSSDGPGGRGLRPAKHKSDRKVGGPSRGSQGQFLSQAGERPNRPAGSVRARLPMCAV